MQSTAQYSSADEKCPEIYDHNKQDEHLEFVNNELRATSVDVTTSPW
jgi:hypothetical protein